MAKVFSLEAVLVDTGIIYALADRTDSWHDRAVSFVSGYGGKLVVPSTVIPEAAYLINRYLGQAAELMFVRSLLAGELAVEQITSADFGRAAELLETYADADIGLVDATVMALAERLKVRRILTTDRRHYGMVKPKHWPAFEAVP